jgi:hypothetical protein
MTARRSEAGRERVESVARGASGSSALLNRGHLAGECPSAEHTAACWIREGSMGHTQMFDELN